MVRAVIDELLERLATFGAISQPRLDDLEEAIGPIFADVDDVAESTTEIHRPPAFGGRAFLFASIHGRHRRITKHDPIAVGTKKIVLNADGLAELVPDHLAFAVGDVEKIEGKHVEIRSHRGWTDAARVSAALAKHPLFRASEIRADRTRLEWYAEGQSPQSFGR